MSSAGLSAAPPPPCRAPRLGSERAKFGLHCCCEPRGARWEEQGMGSRDPATRGASVPRCWGRGVGLGSLGAPLGAMGLAARLTASSPLLPAGPVRLHREHSHHRREGDPAALQRHHQAGHSEETARGRAALPQGPQPARRLDRGVQNPLPRQNSSPDETDPQAAPPVLLEPRGLFSKQQYSKRTCHSIRPTRSRGARALSNAKNPLSFPRSPHPSLPPLPLLACFLLQQGGEW